MAENTLREENCESEGMAEELKSEEPIPNTDDVPNECQGSFGSIVVKEEDISDVEPDDLYKMEVDETNHDVVDSSNPEANDSAQILVQVSVQRPIEMPVPMPVPVPVQESSVAENPAHVRTEKKKKHHRRNRYSYKPTCTHQNKNFVIIKRRLKCAACLAPICPECQHGVKTTLSNHLASSDNRNAYFYHCRLCKLVFKSDCAYKAHSRIHGYGSPYICPDCGGIYKSFYSLSLHLINKCCHVFKIMRGGCELCLRHNMAVRDYLMHIEQAHLKPIFKCSRCECISDCGKTIEDHFQRNHKLEKTVCLRYFSCSVCENLVFSEHIYWKHLEYHTDYSTVFRTGYICACNQSFNTARSIRAHLEGCSRKGVIPPQWSFLQVTLKTYDMDEARNNGANDIFPDSEPDITDGDSNSEGDADIDQDLSDDFDIDHGDFDDDEQSRVLEFLQEEGSSSSTCLSDVSSTRTNSGSTSTVFSDASSNRISPPYVNRPIYSEGSSNQTSESSGKETPDGLEESFSGLTFKELDDSADGAMDESTNDFVYPKSPEESSNGPEEREDLGEKSGLELEDSPQNNERELPSDQEEPNQESPSIPTIDLEEDVSLESQGEIIPQPPPENENGEEDNAQAAAIDEENNENVVYDHIPCDHLGYLKVQQNQEQRKKNKKKKSAKKPACSEGAAAAAGSDNFVVTSVLDEKSGYMKTKRVLIQRSELDKRNPNQLRVNPESSNESLSRDILKTKNSTFFSCPFCPVLFPKHSSSFQKFRLHMECYHSDASLDIDVDRSGAPRSETKFAVVGETNEKSENTSDEDSGDLDELDLETRLNIAAESNEDRNGRSGRSGPSNFGGSSVSGQRIRENIPVRKNKYKDNSAGKFDVEMKLVNDGIEEEMIMESNNPRAANRTGKNSNTRKMHDSTGALVKPSLIQKIVQSKNTNLSKPNQVKPNTLERGFKNIESTERVASATNASKYFGDDNSTGNLDMGRNFAVNFARIDENDSAENNITLHRNQVSILNHKSKRMQDNETVRITQNITQNEPKEGAKKRRRRRRKNSKSSASENDNMSLCSRATLEKEHFAKSSPEGLKNPTNEMESDPQNPENANDSDLHGRSAGQINSGKEKTVWTEFYNSLKVAETLKKINIKDFENPAVEEAPIVTNYPSKRVVKKPKRYRESSDTEESEDEKQSPNFARGFDKAGEDEDISAKKKNLIKRLENVDYRILDYVVNLLEKNENTQTPPKKDTDESLKSSKKKISGEMKPAGKQVKPVMDSDFQDGQDDPKNNGKPKNRKQKPKKGKKKGEVEEKKESDKDQENDKDEDQGQDRDRNQDQDRNRGQDRDQDENRDEARENEEKDNDNGKSKDKNKDDDDDDDDKDKKDKKGKDKSKGKGKDKDKEKDKDKDKNKDKDMDEDKEMNDFNVDEANLERPTGNNPGDGNGNKKRRRRKKPEPLNAQEQKRSGYEAEANPTEKKSGSGDSEFLSSKKKRRLSSKSQYHRRMSVSPENNEFSSGQVISTRFNEAERKLTCAVCGENFSNKAEFKDHILSHRVDENNYQCMECGECFVVRPSLEKHLHAYHKIKDVQKYIEENKCSTPLNEQDSDLEPLKETQCKVCRDEFPTVQDLNKHFRIHGMAFLQLVKKEARRN